jgi:phenylalanyl-tRNA synthetase beta chain
LEYLLSSFGLKYKIVDTEHSSFIPSRVGRVVVKNKRVGYIGEIKPLVLENFELDMPTAALEINLSELFNL